MVDYQSIIGSRAAGALIGAGVGCLAATVTTLWGGYELGSYVNETLHITNTYSRAGFDLCAMTILAIPAFYSGINGGRAVGEVIGAATLSGDKKSNDLGELVLKESNNTGTKSN